MAKWEVEEGVCNLIVSKDGVVISSSEDADDVARKLNAYEDMVGVIEEAANHLYDKQDMSRVKQMAAAVQRKHEVARV